MTRFARILIVGSEGQVGRELQRSFARAGELLCFDRHNVDIADENQVRAMVRSTQPDLILNAAAYTAVDRAESEADTAMAINATAPRVLAEEAAQRNALLVHYSTDYVFDGAKREPWAESDSPNPLNVYGVTKLAGEQAVQQVGGKYLIFRTSWVYGPHGNNFLFTMLRLGKERDKLSIVDDQVGAPTTSIELADATRSVVERASSGECGSQQQWAGLYHMTCAGSTSWFGFAQQIFARTKALTGGRVPVLTPIATRDYPTPAKRPLYSVLSNAQLKQIFGIELPDWESALATTVLKLG
jgi:dTDP-4-dehydrorhamnose reductase